MRAVFALLGCASLVLAAGTACASGGSGRTDPNVAGVLVIEEFLRAANAVELERMAQLHGSREGPISGLYSRSEVTTRMQLMASILKHQNYQVLSTEPVPGRREEAVRADVRMQLTDRSVDVPFVLVWTGQTWLIECIEVERITGTGAGPSCT